MHKGRERQYAQGRNLVTSSVLQSINRSYSPVPPATGWHGTLGDELDGHGIAGAIGGGQPVPIIDRINGYVIEDRSKCGVIGTIQWGCMNLGYLLHLEPSHLLYSSLHLEPSHLLYSSLHLEPSHLLYLLHLEPTHH
jgi:hypothetical protein